MATAAKSNNPLLAPSARSIDIKKAVGIAMDYFREFFPQAVKTMMLEEIEQSTDGKNWLITLGYDATTTSSGRSGPGLMFGPFRAYKIFAVDRNTGKVVSVKIRSVP